MLNNVYIYMLGFFFSPVKFEKNLSIGNSFLYFILHDVYLSVFFYLSCFFVYCSCVISTALCRLIKQIKGCQIFISFIFLQI